MISLETAAACSFRRTQARIEHSLSEHTLTTITATVLGPVTGHVTEHALSS